MAARPLISLARIKQLPAANRLSDADLNTYISGASSLIEKHCGRTFYTQSIEEGFNGSEQEGIFLSCPPIQEISEVTFIDSLRVSTSYTSGCVIWDANSGEVRLNPNVDPGYTTFPYGFQNVQIDYRGGYGTIPEELQDACAETALMMAGQGSTSNDLALGAEAAGDYTHGFRQMGNQRGPITLSIAKLLQDYMAPFGGSRE